MAQVVKSDDTLVSEYMAQGGKVTTVADLSKVGTSKVAKVADLSKVSAMALREYEAETFYLLAKSGKVASQSRVQKGADAMSAITAHRQYVAAANGRFIAQYGDTVVTDLDTGEKVSLAFCQIMEAFFSGEAFA